MHKNILNFSAILLGSEIISPFIFENKGGFYSFSTGAL